MTVSAENDVHYDPYYVEINADPYPMFRPLREESPLYHNERHDFYALSRFADVDNAIVDNKTFISGRGAILEIIKADMEIPPGTLIFEDPPIHDIHRNLLARMFTPRKINALEPKIREYCARSLDPWSAPATSTSSGISARRCRCGIDAARHPRRRPRGDPGPLERDDAHRGRQSP